VSSTHTHTEPLKDDKRHMSSENADEGAPVAAPAPATPAPAPSKRTWDESYAALVAYKETHDGNCNSISWREDTKLAEWVRWQRNHKNDLTEDQIARLDDLGFSWTPVHRTDMEWQAKLQQLMHYKSLHGHSNVPIQGGKDGTWKTLGRWVNRQRELYNKHKLPTDRLAQLEAMGFVWRLTKAAGCRKKEAPRYRAMWHDQYNKLKQFQARHGHCLVKRTGPESDDHLASWVIRQRARKHSLSQERMDLLNAIGFEWNTQAITEGTWEEMFTKLVQFRASKGHVEVPSRKAVDLEDEYHSLHGWLRRQKKLHAAGTLDATKKEKLDLLGVSWEVMETGGKQHTLAIFAPLVVQLAHTIDQIAKPRKHCELKRKFKHFMKELTEEAHDAVQGKRKKRKPPDTTVPKVSAAEQHLARLAPFLKKPLPLPAPLRPPFPTTAPTTANINAGASDSDEYEELSEEDDPKRKKIPPKAVPPIAAFIVARAPTVNDNNKKTSSPAKDASPKKKKASTKKKKALPAKKKTASPSAAEKNKQGNRPTTKRERQPLHPLLQRKQVTVNLPLRRTRSAR
jgi:hypothetical protein